MEFNHDIRECQECGEPYVPTQDADENDLAGVFEGQDLCDDCAGDYCEENGL